MAEIVPAKPLLDKETLEFRLQLLKEEVAFQSDTFDKIDSKTGVALGFTFVVVGQVLASVFRIATDQSHFRCQYPLAIMAVFLSSNFFALLGLVFGSVSRGPKDFSYTSELTPIETNGPYLQLLNNVVESFQEITAENDKIIKKKNLWAGWMYRSVGLALFADLVLGVLLYLFAIPSL